MDQSNNSEGKNFKQKLIKVLLNETKKSTEKLVRFNNSFFLTGLEKDSKAYKKYEILNQ